MVSRTNLNLHPAEQGQCYSHPEKSRFFDTKSKCGANSRPKVPLARINTGEQALFRLPENSAKSPLTQVQNRGFWGIGEIGAFADPLHRIPTRQQTRPHEASKLSCSRLLKGSDGCTED